MPETASTMTAQYRDDAIAMVRILAARIRALLELPRTGQTETQVIQSAVRGQDMARDHTQMLTYFIAE
jgi:hypothetical protein